MQIPLQVTFRNLGRSQAIEASVREHADKLEKYYGRIVGCRVVIEEQHKHHQHGNHYHVRVNLTVPGAELVASREPDEHHAYTDVYVAIRDAFDTARRQLEDYARRHDQRLKAHAAPPHGRIAELHPQENYGRIETPDGRLVYFHRNSVLGADFDQLRVGAEVRFDEEAGERGPQASTVHVVGKHHISP
ncbi:MAG: 30S ribosomal protein S30 [Betaproteobacteria bacterium RIFCSPLOWO2_02_FULL_67_26]|nr:MAG: 30S ribosomal protein S30 [Betaproteobacteria bacterium RIFCSPLOWO2_02_FULL_67_26]